MTNYFPTDHIIYDIINYTEVTSAPNSCVHR